MNDLCNEYISDCIIAAMKDYTHSCDPVLDIDTRNLLNAMVACGLTPYGIEEENINPRVYDTFYLDMLALLTNGEYHIKRCELTTLTISINLK